MAPHGDPFQTYWLRLNLRDRARMTPAPCISWRRQSSLNEVEQLIWNRVRSATRILDYGSGDQALRRKFVEAGYQGEYQTFDVSPEFSTTCTSPDEIDGMFGAVLCLEVLEHMSLAEGLRLRDRLLQWVAPGGWLILSTPNPACILSPFAADETHRHVYPLHDLLTWALAAGMSVEARRVKILPERLTVPMRMRLFTQRVICYLAGVDRADGLLVLARRAPA